MAAQLPLRLNEQTQDTWTEGFWRWSNCSYNFRYSRCRCFGILRPWPWPLRYIPTCMMPLTMRMAASIPLTPLHYLVQVTYTHQLELGRLRFAGGKKWILLTTPGKQNGFGDGSVTSNAGCSTLGGTCLPEFKQVSQANIGFWWSWYKGDFGQVKVGGQYSHTMLDTFADAERHRTHH